MLKLQRFKVKLFNLRIFMRQTIIWLVLGIMILAFTRVFVGSISPFKEGNLNELIQSKEIGPEEWEKLNTEINIAIERGLIFEYLSVNAYIGAFLVSLSLFCIFTSIHLSIDKLFFKDFYVRASLFDATRRSFLFVLAINGIIYLLLYNTEIYVVLVTPLLALIVEILFTKYVKEVFVQKVRRINELSKKPSV